MQRVIINYAAKKTDITGTPAFTSQYSEMLIKQQVIDNAVESSTGDLTLSATAPLLSTFTSSNANYLQLISNIPFYIRTTINGILSGFQKTSLFSYHNNITPIDSIELYSGTSVYTSPSTFTSDGGTISQIVTYIQLKF